MNANFVLDACALIAFLADEEGAEKVERILGDAKRKACKIFMNKINLLEVYYGIYREEGLEKAEEVLNNIRDLPIIIVSSLKSKIFKNAGRLKATYKISLADSIALAEAAAKKARLLTADHHEFDEVEKKEKINFYWIR